MATEAGEPYVGVGRENGTLAGFSTALALYGNISVKNWFLKSKLAMPARPT